MRLLHGLAKIHAAFDDPNLVSRAGLVPVMALAQRAGLGDLVQEHVRIGARCGVNAHLKVACLAAGMTAGGGSIDDMDLLRHGAMPALFGGIRAPSTLGSFLRAFALGNVLQLEKVSRLLLADLARRAPLLPGAGTVAFLDIDSMQERVYGRQKRLWPPGAGRGVRAYQDPGEEPAGAGAERAGRDHQRAAGGAGDRRHEAARRQRGLRPRRRVLRGGLGCRCPRRRVHRDAGGAGGLGVLLRGVHRRRAPGRGVLLSHRADGPESEGGGRGHPGNGLDADPLPPRAIWDDQLRRWVSDAAVAEARYTAFTSKKGKAITARLIVRRVKDQNPGPPAPSLRCPGENGHTSTVSRLPDMSWDCRAAGASMPRSARR